MIEERRLPRVSVRQAGHRLYNAAAILFALFVLAGFARTYYLKGFFDSPPLASVLVHLHGLLMTAWVVLFILQVRLAATGRIRRHRQLGYAGIVLAVAILIAGTVTSLRAARFGAASAPPDIPPMQFLAVPLFDMVMFAILFGGAIYYRRRPATHKTLMLLTAINFLPPALGRIPVLQSLGLLWVLGLPVLLVSAAIAIDRRQHARFNNVFAAAALLLILSYPVRIALMGTSAWLNFATWATSLV